MHWRRKENADVIREKLSQAARSRWPSKLRKYGITERRYRSEISKGHKWCTGHKRFEPRESFGNPDKNYPCKAFVAAKSNAHWHGLPLVERQRIAREQQMLETPESRRKRYLSCCFNINPEQYAALLEKQQGVCAICGRKPKNRRLAIDHDHACCSEPRKCCGKCIRGLLCTPCNRRLAILEYRKDWIQLAAAYIASFKLKETTK